MLSQYENYVMRILSEAMVSEGLDESDIGKKLFKFNLYNSLMSDFSHGFTENRLVDSRLNGRAGVLIRR